MIERYIMRLEPQVKEVVWGGRWLADELGRPGSPEARLGESWEAYSGSRVLNGSLAGRTLGQLFQDAGAQLFGRTAAGYPRFPLLVKFIDARDNLSVQVHPDDSLARQLENYPFGKTEFWYVVEAQPGAEICYGLNERAASRQQLQDAISGGNLPDFLQRSPVRAGDVIFIPAGTVHALTKGIVVYELQQDCDITYRLYDWGRTGREIHIEKGLRAINLDFRNLKVRRPVLENAGGNRAARLIDCPYFSANLAVITENCQADKAGESFMLLTALRGEAALAGEDGQAIEVRRGDTALIPAGLAYSVVPHSPEFVFISGWLNES